jgi:two-component system nitrate/nitrite response regulator NarL
LAKVFLLSDQPVLLRGLEYVLASGGFEIAGSCPANVFLTALDAALPPDLLLLDVTAGLTLAALSEVHRLVSKCPLVLWTDALPLHFVVKTMEFGVRGIVRRNARPEQLVSALRNVLAGELQIGSGVTAAEMPPGQGVSLTPREREIISFLRQGMRNKQIGGEMGITEGTVKIYLFRLFHKLGVRNRLELARCDASH